MESTDPRKSPCFSQKVVDVRGRIRPVITWSDLESLQFTTPEGMPWSLYEVHETKLNCNVHVIKRDICR